MSKFIDCVGNKQGAGMPGTQRDIAFLQLAVIGLRTSLYYINQNEFTSEIKTPLFH
jgi:hypothetical protein